MVPTHINHSTSDGSLPECMALPMGSDDHADQASGRKHLDLLASCFPDIWRRGNPWQALLSFGIMLVNELFISDSCQWLIRVGQGIKEICGNKPGNPNLVSVLQAHLQHNWTEISCFNVIWMNWKMHPATEQGTRNAVKSGIAAAESDYPWYFPAKRTICPGKGSSMKQTMLRWQMLHQWGLERKQQSHISQINEMRLVLVHHG